MWKITFLKIFNECVEIFSIYLHILLRLKKKKLKLQLLRDN